VTLPAPDRLAAALRRLAPWPPDRQLSPEEWGSYIEAARLVQQTPPDAVERALLGFLDESTGAGSAENESPLFLLMRVVFDLPERRPAGDRRVFKGWINWPAPDAGGSVNLAWPVTWQAGRPSLAAPFAGADGSRYGALEEYRHLLAHFPFRPHSTP
jgi:hypothetical protein